MFNEVFKDFSRIDPKPYTKEQVFEDVSRSFYRMAESKVRYDYKAQNLYGRGMRSEHPFEQIIYQRIDQHNTDDRSSIFMMRKNVATYEQFQRVLPRLYSEDERELQSVSIQYSNYSEIIEYMALVANNKDFILHAIANWDNPYAVALALLNRNIDTKTPEVDAVLDDMLFGSGYKRKYSIVIYMGAVTSEPRHGTLIRIFEEQDIITQATGLYHWHDIEAIKWLSKNSKYKEIRYSASKILHQGKNSLLRS